MDGIKTSINLETWTDGIPDTDDLLDDGDEEKLLIIDVTGEVNVDMEGEEETPPDPVLDFLYGPPDGNIDTPTIYDVDPTQSNPKEDDDRKNDDSMEPATEQGDADKVKDADIVQPNPKEDDDSKIDDNMEPGTEHGDAKNGQQRAPGGSRSQTWKCK